MGQRSNNRYAGYRAAPASLGSFRVWGFQVPERGVSTVGLLLIGSRYPRQGRNVEGRVQVPTEEDELEEVEENEDDEEEIDDEDLEEEEAKATLGDDDEDDDEASLDELLAKRSASRRGTDDSDDDDDIMSFVPEPDLGTAEPLPSKLKPVKDQQEFVCANCHLVKKKSQLADEKRGLCRDCV